jgi:hypothetical protein
MTERNDILTASRINLVLILLPIISVDEAACAMPPSGVPAQVVTRVASMPAERRPTVVPECVYEAAPTGDGVREALDNDG